MREDEAGAKSDHSTDRTTAQSHSTWVGPAWWQWQASLAAQWLLGRCKGEYLGPSSINTASWAQQGQGWGRVNLQHGSAWAEPGLLGPWAAAEWVQVPGQAGQGT